MRIYRFYKKPEANTEEDRKPVLYAVTNNKELAQMFRKTRNMKKFIERNDGHYEPEEYSEFVNNNQGCQLKICKLNTRKEKNNTIVIKRVDVLVTLMEETNIQNPYSLIEDEVWWAQEGRFGNPFFFKDKYVEALNFFDYCNIYKIMCQPYDTYIPDEYDDFSAPAFDVDELAYFIDTYMDLLSDE